MWLHSGMRIGSIEEEKTKNFKEGGVAKKLSKNLEGECWNYFKSLVFFSWVGYRVGWDCKKTPLRH